MPKIDFHDVAEVSDFAPVPDGEYHCQLVDVEQDVTRTGDEMWKLRWQIEGGEHAGRLLFDNLIFSPRALPRVKLICAACGLDVSGEVDLATEMLMNRQAMVTAETEEYEDVNGATKVRNRIPWDGYRSVPQVGAEPPF